MQAGGRARLTELESHADLCRFAVAEVLLDVHAQPIQSHDFFGPKGAQLRRVREQPRFAGTGFCFAPRLGRGAVTGATITLAAHRATPVEHHVAAKAEAARQPAIPAAAGFARGLCKPGTGWFPMAALARHTHARANAPNPRPP